MRDLALTHRFVRYDERGCGLSNGDAGEFTLENWVTDLETVVEAVGLERFRCSGCRRAARWR